MVLDFSLYDGMDSSLADLLITSHGEKIWEDTVDMAVYGQGYEAYVPRELLHVRVWSGTGGLASEAGLSIPLGKDCPRIYMHDSDVEAAGEDCHETVRLRKNHCVMRVTVAGDGGFPYRMTVRGNVAGYDATGNPLPGDFEYVLHDDGFEDGYHVVLPRQLDSSLLLEIDDGTGEYRSFAIGQYIVSSGYDWQSDDLEDVTVTIDYALTEIRLSIKGWESVYVYEMIM